jgi:hypothetical protein
MLTPEEAAAVNGMTIVSVAEFTARVAALGYTLDRSMDFRAPARFMTGPYAGKAYMCCSAYPRETDTALSAWNIAARRDANFQALQQLRGAICAISRGALLEI